MPEPAVLRRGPQVPARRMVRPASVPGANLAARAAGVPDVSPETGRAYVNKNAFFYNTGIDVELTVALGTTSSKFQIDGDSDFFCTKLTVYAAVGHAGMVSDALVVPGVSILITNGTNGRAYMNEAVPLPNIAGTGQLPFIVPMMLYFPNKALITVQYNNITDDVDYSEIELTFNGYKAFI